MLEKNIIDQLKEVFSKLENPVELVYAKSSHDKQEELLLMLNQIVETSEKILLSEGNFRSDYPQFILRYQGKPNGVKFSGIPGGHEFSSLILSILNSDLKGKLPDEALIQKIKSLKGPIKIKTYISLSCENCPEVVQALNLMAILHGNFEHEMIDGEFVQDEIEALKIQGVPSVVVNGKMIHSGKSNLMELLKKLENEFGIDEDIVIEPKDLGEFDVAIVGGGPAGISSAIYSARKGLKTVIITDRVGGQLQETKGIENFVGTSYTEGKQLSEDLRKHMIEHDLTLLEHRKVSQVINGDLKFLELDTHENLKTKSLIVATGAKWRELNIPGEKEYLGRGVAFCPHCDGPFYKGKDIIVIGGGNSGVEAAIDLAGIVKSVTVFEFMPELKADQVLINKLNSLSNTKIITNARTSQVLGNGEKVTGIEYEDRTNGEIKTLETNGIFVQIGLLPNSGFIKDIVETNQFGEIIIDEKCRTSVPGIYAAGDVSTVPYKQIVVSVGEGAKASLASFEDLMMH